MNTTPLVISDPTATEIGRLYTLSRTNLVESVRCAWECGCRLKDKKDSMKHGEWLPWLTEHAKTLGFETDRTARMLMKAASNRKSTSDIAPAEAVAASRQLWGNTRSQPPDPETPPTTPVVGETITIQSHVDAGNVFTTFYVDPPWPYDNQGTRAATSNHYSTMSLDEIAAEPISKICAEQAHLHLWTTNAFLFDAKSIMDAWGFEYKSVLIWNKPQVGLGNYWRVNHEYLLWGIKGGLQPIKTEAVQKARLRSVITHDRLKHSQKPEIFRTLVETVSPGPYIEGYARTTTPAWERWGNQID